MFAELKHNEIREYGSKKPLNIAQTLPYNMFYMMEHFERFLFGRCMGSNFLKSKKFLKEKAT